MYSKVLTARLSLTCAALALVPGAVWSADDAAGVLRVCEEIGLR